MKEKLRKNQLLLRLLSILLVLIPIISAFIPFFKMTKTVENLGIKETITAEYSIFQMIIQDDSVKLTSSSALGNFDGFNTTTMDDLLGGEKIASIVTVAFIALSISVVCLGLGILFSSLVATATETTVKYFTFTCYIFYFFAYFVPMGIVSTMKITTGSVVVGIGIFGVITVIDGVLGGTFKDIEEINIEIFLSKYKNYDPKWFEDFKHDLLDYLSTAGFSLGFNTLSRITEHVDTYTKNEASGNNQSNNIK